MKITKVQPTIKYHNDDGQNRIKTLDKMDKKSKTNVMPDLSYFDITNISIQYKMYGDKSNRVAVEIVNKDTGDVIREIPSKELQRIQEAIKEMLSKMVDTVA
jgi:uncharacterized FlaG/YvyC family protein